MIARKCFLIWQQKMSMSKKQRAKMKKQEQPKGDEIWFSSWIKVLKFIERELGIKPLVIQIGAKEHPDEYQRYLAFDNAFKAPTERLPIVISSGLSYTFRGNMEPTSAEWLGAPALNQIFYICHKTGRVAMTGTHPSESK